MTWTSVEDGLPNDGEECVLVCMQPPYQWQREERTCPGCQSLFTPKRSDAICCSATCRKRRERHT
jgi:hypothetical protein